MKKITNIELKQKIKDLAVSIKELKATRKQVEYGYLPGIASLKYEFRHYHIAASLLRGKTMEQIETPAPDNKPNEYYINSIIQLIVFVNKKDIEEEVVI